MGGAAGSSSLAAARQSEVSVHDDFEKLASELSREVKAQPTDRLQSEGELATAEARREAKRQAEQARLERLRLEGQRAEQRRADQAKPPAPGLVEGFDIEPFYDFSAK